MDDVAAAAVRRGVRRAEPERGPPAAERGGLRGGMRKESSPLRCRRGVRETGAHCSRRQKRMSIDVAPAVRLQQQLVRNVRQVSEGGVRRLGSSRETTVRSATAISSFRTWILGGAPERIRRGHSCDEGLDLGGDGRAAYRGPAGERGPVLAYPGQPDPEEPIAPAQLRSSRRSLVHRELLAQGGVLEGELAVAAAEERDESKQVDQRADHGTAIASGSEPRDQPLICRTGFWRRTAHAKTA